MIEPSISGQVQALDLDNSSVLFLFPHEKLPLGNHEFLAQLGIVENGDVDPTPHSHVCLQTNQ